MKRKGLLLAGLLAISLLLVFAAPGSEDDPLVSVSYVETKLADLKVELLTAMRAEIDAALAEQSAPVQTEATTELPVQTTEPVAVAQFEALSFPAGSQIVFGASTEFIVRRGRATLIDPDQNNLPDLTTGVDIARGADIPLNHLMLCPRRDGRGLTVSEDSAEFWIMIKGEYIVIK